MKRAKLPKIHWTTIIEEHTLAWQKFWDWISKDHRGDMCEYDIEIFEKVKETSIEYDKESLENMIMFGSLYDFAHFNRGDLYTFFDINEVYLTVRPASLVPNRKPKEWTCIVNMNFDNMVLHNATSASCRQSAEETGFLSAFKMLNRKLKANEHK